MLRLGFIVFIGFSVGCWNNQRTTNVPDVVKEKSVQEPSGTSTNTEKKTPPQVRKTDHCYDFTNDTKIYTGRVILSRTSCPDLRHAFISKNQPNIKQAVSTQLWRANRVYTGRMWTSCRPSWAIIVAIRTTKMKAPSGVTAPTVQTGANSAQSHGVGAHRIVIVIVPVPDIWAVSTTLLTAFHVKCGMSIIHTRYAKYPTVSMRAPSVHAQLVMLFSHRRSKPDKLLLWSGWSETSLVLQGNGSWQWWAKLGLLRRYVWLRGQLFQLLRLLVWLWRL